MITATLLGGPYDGETFVIFSGHAISLPKPTTPVEAMKTAPVDRVLYKKRVLDQGGGDLVTVWVPDDLSSDDALKLLKGEKENERN